LVLYNSDSPQGIEIANYYAQVHPGVQLLGLAGVTTNEEITADYYLQNIRPQILSALTPSTSCIVTTKGLPLRISVTESNPEVYVDPFGVTRQVDASRWKPYSSLESELTRIDTISSWQQMGDQYFSDKRMNNPSLDPYYPNFPIPNYKTIGPFDRSLYGGMRLTARLDGFTVSDVTSSIQRAQHAYLISKSRWIVLDDDPNSAGGDRLPQLKFLLASKAQAYAYENNDAATTTASGPVIGYISHGTNDGVGGLDTGYLAQQINFTMAKGAVFFTHESYNAYSFQQGRNYEGQGLVADWLQIGGTAGVGNVWEPQSGTNYEVNEDLLFKMLLEGYTWGEAAWSSMTELSYVQTVVGDPLMTWKKPILGDANLDGVVNVDDYGCVDSGFGTDGGWEMGDFDQNGLINVDDYGILDAAFEQSSTGANAAVPEPSILVLLIGSVLTSVVVYLRKR
jgi:uncharacterized protein (TIGR03790 family)